MLKKLLFFLISLITGTVLFVAVVHFVGWQETKSALALFTGWQGLVILLLTGLMIFFGLWKWKLILNSQGYNLSKKELASPYFAGFSLSYLFPIFMGGGTGTFLKGYVLREKFFIPWKKGVVSLIIERFLDTSIGLLVILTGFIFFLSKMGLPSGNIGIILFSVVGILTIAVGFLYFKFFKSESIINFFAKFFSKSKFVNGTAREIEKDIFDFFEPKKLIFWQVVGMSFLKIAMIGLRGWVLLLFLGELIDPFSALIILAFYYLAFFIPVPAMLGTHEVTQTLAFGALEIGTGLAPAFTMIQRGADVFISLIGLMLFFRLGIGLFYAFLFKKTENLIEDKNN